MLPRLVPEISPLYAFCDVVVVGVVGVVVVVGIGDSRSWIVSGFPLGHCKLSVLAKVCLALL